MPGVCLYRYLAHLDPGVSRPGSWIKLSAPLGVCSVTERSYCYIGDVWKESKITYTHNNCVCNAYLALTLRHQANTSKLDLSMLNPFSYELDLLLESNHSLIIDNLYTRREVVAGYKGRWWAR